MDLTKKYYKISEVTELTSIPASTLRFWEGEFSQLKVERNDRGTRFYTPANIELILQLKYLLHDKGLHIDSAKEQLRAASNTVATRTRAINRLMEVRQALVDLQKSLSMR